MRSFNYNWTVFFDCPFELITTDMRLVLIAFLLLGVSEISGVSDITGIYEPRHDKTNKMAVCPAKTQISLGTRPVWSESSLSAWRKLGSVTIHWARMPRLSWVFAGRTLILLVLSCRGSTMLRFYTPSYTKSNSSSSTSKQWDFAIPRLNWRH